VGTCLFSGQELLLNLFTGFRSSLTTRRLVNSRRFCGCRPSTRSTPSATCSYPTCALRMPLGMTQEALLRPTTGILRTHSLIQTRSLNCSMNVKWISLCHSPFTGPAPQASSLSQTPILPSNLLPFPSPKLSEDSARSENGNGNLPGAFCSWTANRTHRTNVDHLIFVRRILDRPCKTFYAPSTLRLME